MKLVDLSHRLEAATPPFPGDAPLELTRVRALEADGYTAWQLTAGMHVGTHVDVPMHMVPDGRFAADFPLESFCGPGRLAWLPGAQVITADMLGTLDAPCLLIATGWSRHFPSNPARYFARHPCLTQEAARHIIGSGVRILGLDTPSPDGPPYTLHRQLLAAGVLLAENLTGLEALQGVPFTFFAPPLKLAAEGSPTRAFALVAPGGPSL